MENSTTPTRSKVWQVAFLSGIAACIVSSIVILGTSIFATILTVSTLFIGILNALLGQASGGAKGENWFVSTTKHALDVGTFLKIATVGVWIGAATLVGYSVMRGRHEAQIITLEGHVLSAGGQPAGNALVILTSADSRQTVTGADGKFNFTRVDLSREPSKKLRLEITWDQLNKTEFVDVSNGPPANLRLVMPPGPPPFRVLYRFVEGKAIDLLLRGEIDAKWDAALGGNKAVIPNSVYNSLRNLARNFSETEELTDAGDSAYDLKTKSGSKTDPGLAKKLIGKPSFVGSSGVSINGTPTRDDLLSLTDTKRGWNAIVNPEGIEGGPALDSVQFWRFASRDDFRRLAAQYQSKTIDFYNHITSNSLPSDFSLVLLQNTSCGGEDSEVALVLVPRMLRVRVAVIENISSTPIIIENFTIKDSTAETIRSRQDEESSQSAQSPKEANLYSAEILPHERLEIPLEMSLIYDSPDGNVSLHGFERPVAASVRNKVIGELSKQPRHTFQFEGSPFDIESQRILEMLNGQDPLLEKEYLFGPSMKIENVKVRGVNYPFREFDSSRVAIRFDNSIGSCPYVYTYDAKTNQWINEGHILYARNGKAKESVDEKDLERFDGRIIIKEEDPEVSYIDSFLLRITTTDGHERLIAPDDFRLRDNDGNYLRMSQGQQLEVRFNVPRGLRVKKYTLVAKGYYVPFKAARTAARAKSF